MKPFEDRSPPPPPAPALIARDVSLSSMERALRTLSPGRDGGGRSKPLTPRNQPLTPRPPGDGSVGSRKKSFKSSSSSSSARSASSAKKRTGRRSNDSNVSGSSSVRSGGIGRGGDGGGGEENVRVAIRMRPLAAKDRSGGRAWRASSERNSVAQIPVAQGGDDDRSKLAKSGGGGRRRSSGESEYYYDRVFDESAATEEIYAELVRGVVESAAEEGISGTVFAYGQTSSGKTHTMQGSDDGSCAGVVQLAARDVFRALEGGEGGEERGGTKARRYSVRVSYVEIYNEEFRDLLRESDGASQPLLIREDKRGAIAVDGLTEVPVSSPQELVDVFRRGGANKSVGATKMNDRSSRSHAILKIVVERKEALDVGGEEDKENAGDSNHAPAAASGDGAGGGEVWVTTRSELNLVDLAGSESVRHTGAKGMQKKEGGMINQSLLTLSKVLMSLGQKRPGHVNYRDSKLTRILKPSLSGNARMAVICCASPSANYVEETRSTLQFATRAKLVTTSAVANEIVEDADLIARLRLEGAKARKECQKVEERLRKAERTNMEAIATRRRLENLEKFVLSESRARVGRARLVRDAEFYEDERCDVRSYSTADAGSSHKDDFHLRPSVGREDGPDSSASWNMLRAALDLKAQQVKHLQAELQETVRDDKVNRGRCSLIGETRSPDVSRRCSDVHKLRRSNAHELCDHDRRTSLIGEARSPDASRRKSGVRKMRSSNVHELRSPPRFSDDDMSLIEEGTSPEGDRRCLDVRKLRRSNVHELRSPIKNTRSPDTSRRRSDVRKMRSSNVHELRFSDDEMSPSEEETSPEGDRRCSDVHKLRRSNVHELRSPDDDCRMSLIEEAESPDASRRCSDVHKLRLSNVHELRSPDEKPKAQCQDIGQDEREQWEAKVASANGLIAELECQIDDLTSQKNDALDWIEELIAKSDRKDEKIKQATEARDEAKKRCEGLRAELEETKKVLEVKSRDLDVMSSQADALEAETNMLKKTLDSHALELSTARERCDAMDENLQLVRDENRQLLHEQHGNDVKVKNLEEKITQLVSEEAEIANATGSLGEGSADSEDSMLKANEVLRGQLKDLEDFTNEYADEKRALVDQIEKYEDELSQADALLKVKSNELDDALFSLEDERDKWMKEKRELEDRLESSQLSPKALEQLREENERLKVEKLDLTKDYDAQIEALNEENEGLRAVKLHFEDKCMQKIDDLTCELSEAWKQLETVKRDEVNELSESNHIGDLIVDEPCRNDPNDLMQTIDVLSNKWRGVKQHLDEAKENNTSVVELKKEFSSLRSQHIRLTEDLSRSQEASDHLQADIDRLSKENDRLKSDLLESTKEVETCRIKMDSLSNEVDESHKQINTSRQMVEEHDKLMTEHLRLKQDVEAYKEEIENLTNMLAEAREYIATGADLEVENKRLIDQSEKCQQQICDISRKLAEAHKQIADAKVHNYKARLANQDVDGLKAENVRLKAERRHLTVDLEESREKMDSLSKELHVINAQLRDKRKDDSITEDRVAKAEKENSQLQKHIAAANAKMKELRAESLDTKREMDVLQRTKNEELSKSVSKIQHLVEELSDLKRTRGCLESRSRELQNLLSTATSERDVAFDERDNLMKFHSSLLTKNKRLSDERDAALRDKENFRMKLDKIAAEFEADYETVRSKIDALLTEKKDLEAKVTFLEASKASVEGNADRILERDNALAGQYDRLKAEFKKQTMKIAELEDEVLQLVKRLARLKGENGQLLRDNCAMKDMIQAPEVTNEVSNHKKKALFGFKSSK